MIKWTAFPFLRFLAALISGILFYLFSRSSFNFIPLLLSAIVCYLLIFTISKIYTSTYSFKPFLGITGMGILFLSGIQISQQHDFLQREDHISKSLPDIRYYTATVSNDPEEKEKVFKALVSVTRIRTEEGWKNSSGKIFIYIKKQNENKLIYGDQILVKGKPQEIPGPANPEEFDYRKYLSFQNIYHQHFIPSQKDIYVIGKDPPNAMIVYSGKLRQACDRIYKIYLSPEEYKIASALVLGIRNTLDNNIKDAYSNTGTMHILAVSGLHVAIIFQILMLVLGKISKVRFCNYLLPAALLILLWFYAFMTGLSPSVLRAVTMFSFIIFAKALKRNTNIYNTLALSALLLLCFDPFYLVDVGFQLSYLAVAGIVYLHPKIYNSISNLNPALDKIWEMTSISLAAQISTFPLGLLYFHQFPVYFLIANFLVIPIAFLILYLALGLLALSWFPFAAHYCAWCLEKLIWLMNYIVSVIEKFPYALINGIDISISETIIIYCSIIFLLTFLYLKKLRHLFLSLILVMVLSSFQLYKAFDKTNFAQMVIFNIKGHSAIGFLKGDKAELLLDSSLLAQPSKIKYHINGYLYKSGIKDIKINSIEKFNSLVPYRDLKDALLLSWQGKIILITGKNFKKENYKNLSLDFIIARNNSIRNITETEKIINCRNLIIDSSNNPKYIKGETSSMNSHNVLKNGAVVLDF
jgi:competence protein ComEC